MKRDRNELDAKLAVSQEVIKKLTEQQKILGKDFFFLLFFFFSFVVAVLASLLPCDDCLYYCNVSATPNVPCAVPVEPLFSSVRMSVSIASTIA